ncbi:DUF3298 domain-containing protein [Paenibacillus taichungensis]
MRKGFFRCAALILLFALFIPHQLIFAASNSPVKTKIMNYKGQKYVQLTGGKKNVTEKINKEIKTHAVNAAKLDTELKKEDKSHFYTSVASTKYNKNKQVSIVFIDAAFTGGAHELYSTYTYNYNLETGKQIQLKDIVYTDSQISNLIISISYNLTQFQKSGRAIFDENIFDFPISPDTPFYLYDEGIVIKFNPYEVAPFSEGFVDVNVPFSVINGEDIARSNTTTTPSTSSYIESQIDDDFEGYDDGNLYELSNGQIWKQVEYKYTYSYSYRPDVVIYKDGSRYYMQVEGMTDKVQVERIK